jgi:hypothetical protein
MGSGYRRLFAQEMDMRSFVLNLTQILAGVALIMTSTGVVHAQSVVVAKKKGEKCSGTLECEKTQKDPTKNLVCRSDSPDLRKGPGVMRCLDPIPKPAGVKGG